MKRSATCFLLLATAIISLAAAAKLWKVRSFEELKELIQTEQIQSVEQLLPHLDEELRSNFSLIVSSRSPQEASFENPRVNLYSNDGSMILAFNGGGKQRGGNSVEVISVDAKTKLFNFAQVTFQPNGKPKFSSPEDSAKCLACHAKSKIRAIALLEAHPNWDSYPDWPDRYGASHFPGKEGGSSRAVRSTKMEHAFKKFQKKALTHPRYRHLIGLAETNLEELGIRNFHLGDILAKRVMTKIARLVTENPMYKSLEKAIKDLEGVDVDFLRRLPAELAEEYSKVGKSLEEEVLAQQEKYFQLKLKRFSELTGTKTEAVDMRKRTASSISYLFNFNSNTHYVYARAKFLLEKMGIPVDVMNLTLEQSSFSMAQGTASLRFLGKVITEFEKKEGLPPQCAVDFAKLSIE